MFSGIWRIRSGDEAPIDRPAFPPGESECCVFVLPPEKALALQEILGLLQQGANAKKSSELHTSYANEKTLRGKASKKLLEKLKEFKMLDSLRRPSRRNLILKLKGAFLPPLLGPFTTQSFGEIFEFSSQ